MTNHVTFKPLKSLAVKIFSGAPAYSISKLVESADGIPFVNIKDINDSQILINELPLFSLNNFKNSERYMVYPGDILITCRGTHLKSTVVPANVKKLIISSNLIAVHLSSQISPEFLAAYLNTQQGQKDFLANATSTGQLTLKVSDAGKVIIPVPLLSLQEKIVNLADAIEKQYRLNLEAANLRRLISNEVIVDMLKSGGTTWVD